ncbi:hypothetical protein [Methanosarcina barkeri]|uniref:hypothetical protein n=1 Tax=Methanosarcina barkeri TaxID=2208 RepID=UPI001E37CB02|nr:hypothetical protein [Methanosarcina barkeri]
MIDKGNSQNEYITSAPLMSTHPIFRALPRGEQGPTVYPPVSALVVPTAVLRKRIKSKLFFHIVSHNLINLFVNQIV